MKCVRLMLVTFVFAVVTYGNTLRAVEVLAPPPVLPAWIWHVEQREPNQSASFTKSFHINQPVASAMLRCVGESAGLVITLNGEVIADVLPYDPIKKIDVSTRLRVGDHRLQVAAKSVAGPAAFFMILEIVRGDGTIATIVSDNGWTVDSKPAIEFGAVDERLVIPRHRQIGVRATDNYEQWKQALAADDGTDPATFSIVDDFEVQLVRSAKPDEDSWVSLAFDASGRAIIAKEKKGLLRMTLSPLGERVTKTELINDSLKECRGILPLGRNLYVNANNSKSLYRIIGDAQGNFSEPEMILATSGGVGHGRNDLALGPDEMIYSIHGDAVHLPPSATDHTSPFRDARRGKQTSEGHLLRIDPKTLSTEILAAGLRNPFGIDFNKDGEVFTYDADAEHDMGSSWYRPTRVDHLVTGGDFGWRGVTGSWPSYYPDHADNARPNLDIGKGSPTAVKFGTGSDFPRRFREALFILDWAYGRIIVVHVVPRGASYLMTAESFLQGRPLNVTDLDFAADGAMYFVTGGRKTRSALYRVRYVGQVDRQSQPKEPTAQQLARRTFASSSRQLRHQLEAQLVMEPSTKTLAQVWTHLSSSDPWVQQAAIHLIERTPLKWWADRALQEDSLTPAVAALLSLARSKNEELRPAVVDRLNQLSLSDASRDDKLKALQAYWICLGEEIGSGQLTDAAREKLNEMYPDPSYAVNRLLSELLVRLHAESVTDKTIGLLNEATRQDQQMHYLYVLRNVDHGWTVQHRRTYFRSLTDAKHYLGGAGMPGFLEKIRNEAIETLTDDEREKIADLISNEVESSAALLGQPREFVRKWSIDAVRSLDTGKHRPALARGEEMFRAAACANCHRIAGQGTLVGPELTDVSRRFSRGDLVKSIIQPSAVISEKYRSLQIVTHDGDVHTGRVALGGDYRSPVLRLANDPQQPLRSIEIAKSDIESQRYSPVSWMPEGLLNTLTGEEIMDLLAYIESGGRK